MAQYPYQSDIERAYNELKAEGKIKPRPASEQHLVEQDKGLITQRGAYYANQKNPMIGTMEKSSGNHYVAADGQKYSVDWNLRRSDGVGWDVVTDRDSGDNMREACPVNGEEHPPDPSVIPRWRQPSAENAQVSGEGGGGGDVTPPVPGGSLLDRDIRPWDVAYQTFVSDASEFDRLGREWYTEWSGQEPALSDLHHGYWRCMMEREQWQTPRNAFNDAWPLPPDRQPESGGKQQAGQPGQQPGGSRPTPR